VSPELITLNKMIDQALDLAMIAPGSEVRNVDLLTGIAAHDLYHAGQIQLLKRFHSSSGKLPV